MRLNKCPHCGGTTGVEWKRITISSKKFPDIHHYEVYIGKICLFTIQ